MAQLAFSVVGGVVGAYFGQPALGWAIGSAIGGVVDPQRIQGPRLSDLKVQASAYGAAEPIVYGGVRIAGNVVWSADLVEHSDSGGKGGPVVTNFTYTVSMAINICAGHIDSVRRIWADSKLVYDMSDADDGAAQAASTAFSEFFVFYHGDEAQDPDPTMEAALGVGNVPAYRGSCYIVFTDLPLVDYGNRIPSFSFELGAESTVTSSGGEFYAPLIVGPWVGDPTRPVHSLGSGEEYRNYSLSHAWNDYDAARVANAALYSDTGQYSETYIGFSTSTTVKANVFTDGATLDDDPQYVYYFMSYEVPDVVIDFSSVGLPYPDSSAWCGPLHLSGAGPADGKSYWTADSDHYRNNNQDLVVKLYDYSTYPTTGPYSQFANNCTNYPTGLPQAAGQRFIAMRVERVPGPPLGGPKCFPGDPCMLGIAEMPGDPSLCITCDGTISPNSTISYTQVAGTFKQLAGIQYRVGVLYQNALGPVHVPSDPEYSDAGYWADARTAAITAGTLAADAVSPVVVNEAALASISSTITVVAPGSALLSDIVTDICARCGLAAGQNDVTDLTDTVDGFVIGRQMPGRSAIEPLRMTYWFDAVESGDKVRFVKRGAAAAVTVGYGDLGAGEGDADTAAVEPKRAQESDLPARVYVSYMANSREYETGAQSARRMTTGSQQVVNVELPMVMTDAKGAEVADVLMYDAWTARNQRSWSTTQAFTEYEPTDMLTIDDGQFVYSVRVTDKSEEGPVIRWKGVDDSASAYSPNVSAGTGGGRSTIRFPGPMNLVLMDVPIVRDDDNAPGYYAAASGYTTTWAGGRYYRSTDGGVSYAEVDDMTATATIGLASTALGDFYGGNTVDEANTVTVRMNAGTLATVTNDQLLGGANLAMLGDELIQFTRADLVSTRVYALSGLLRGRRGTEQHMDAHVTDERFVLFNSAIYRESEALANINVTTHFKAVTYGSSIASITAQDFTDTGAGLKPLAVVHLNSVDAGGGDYTITWVRRSRIGGEWRDSVDVPLGEAFEQYGVDVVRVGSVISSALVTTQTATVTAVAGDVVRIYQLSDLVGRGFVAEVTLE